jgi:hypothetical protein
MRRTLLEARVAGCILFLLLSLPVFAQFNAGVQGTVLDPKGNAVPNATVTLVNSGTGISQKAVSTDSGVYRFTSIQAGNYTVSANVQGFATASVAIVLTTDQLLNVPLNLVVGATTSTVTVTTEAPLLDTSDSRLEETLNNTALQDLPLAGRNPTNVLTVAPGVTGLGGQSSPGASTSTNFAPENWVNASANGRGANGNLYIVDGMDITSFIRPGVLNLTPNADSLQEVSVQTNTYTVDYGRNSSIQTVMTSKTGSNDFHGIASDYYESQQLQARGEFGIPKGTPLPPYHISNFSFNLGGPVIPHHEFFFFVDYEPYYSIAANSSSIQTYEDPAFVSFAQNTAQSKNTGETQILAKYPASAATTTGVSQTAGQLWAPNPSACYDGTGDLGAAYDDIPCSTAVFDTGRYTPSSIYNAKQYNIRLDKDFKKDRIFGNFYRNTAETGGPDIRPAFNTSSDYYVFNLQANETHTFSSNMLNEAIFNYSRIEGFADRDGLYTVPLISVTNLGNGFGDGFADGDYIQHAYAWRDVLTRIVGSHSIKAGVNVWRGDDDVFFQGADGIPSLFYTNMINFINDDIYSESGLSYNVVSGQPVPYTYGYKSTTIGIFAEDSWKVNRKLTVNYGLRYDNNGNPYVDEALPPKSFNAPKNVISNMTLGSGSSLAAQVANAVFKVQPNVYPSDRNWIFSPRGGFAYDPFENGKWVLRGGVGLFRDLPTLGNQENLLGNNAPGPTEPTFYSNGSTAPPVFGFGTQNTYPFGFTYPAFVGTPLDAAGGIVGSNISMGAVQQNLTMPYTVSWSGAVERALTANMTASLGYTGTHSSNLIVVGGNTSDTSYDADVNLVPGDLIQHPAFAGGVWTGTGIQTRLNPSFGHIYYEFNGARANYYAIIAAVKGRFGRHGFLTASYTHSASKDDSTNYPDGYTLAGGGVNFDVNQFYSPSNWDVPNRVSMGASYDIPGLNNGGGFVKRLTNGFNLASTMILQSGNPFYVTSQSPLALVDTTGVTVTPANYASELAAGNITYAPGSGNYSADGDYGPDLNVSTGGDVPDALSYNQKHNRKAYQYTGVVDSGIITHAQFAAPTFNANGAEGNEKMNSFRNPGYADVDLTVRKSTAITERVQLQFRVDFFNLFNRVNLNGVDANFNDTSAGFGTTGSSLPPRYEQLGAKVVF